MRAVIEGTSIRSVSCVVPSGVFHVSSLGGMFGEREIRRITQSTGIDELRIVDDSTTASDLCEAAARSLFEAEKMSGSDVDALIFVSQTPDYILPATSCVLQHRLGLPTTAFTLDVNNGCCGYVYGLYLASLLISSGSCSRVLLLTGDTISRLVGDGDRSLRTILGDGGSATLVEKGAGRAVFEMHTYGSRHNALIVPAGGMRNPATVRTSEIHEREAGNRRSDEDLYMDGMEMMKFVLSDVIRMIRGSLKEENLSGEDVGLFVFHQANRFIVEALARNMGIEEGRVLLSVDGFGNTGPASIPLALTNCLSSGERRASLDLSRTMAVGFGVGLTCGTAIVDLSSTEILPVGEYSGSSIYEGEER